MSILYVCILFYEAFHKSMSNSYTVQNMLNVIE